MVREAEENAESDKKLVELVQARNSAESASHSISKDFDEYKDQLTEEEKTLFETAKSALNDAIKGEDKEVIDKAVNTLFESSSPVLAKKQAAEQAKQAEATKGEQTVDASFTEVDKTDTQ
jgi:molecular chaperone DnaK